MALARISQILRQSWPWLVLSLLVAAAVWHDIHFPDDVDPEFPGVVRPTFSPHPPPAYRLAEPGDTIDRIAIYISSLAIVLATTGLIRDRQHRRPWLAGLAIGLTAFWYAATPWPTFDGWHGLAWRTLLEPSTPTGQRILLGLGALTLATTVLQGLWVLPWRNGRGVVGLLVVAILLAVVRVANVLDVEPFGYWPRWAFVWALAAFSAALVRLQPAREGRRIGAAAWRFGLAGLALWFVMVMGGIELTWYHRPIARLRAVAPGKIYICAMPTGRGLEIAQARHHFRTIINLFPEDTPYRSPRLPEELRFAREHGLSYHGSPAQASASNEFLDETLRVARDPSAWPILVHCHGCMDRTPAWAGIYQFVEEGRPLAEVFRFIEQHRGYRPKATVTLLYNRVLPRLAPERLMNDPTSALLSRCAEGTVDPYYRQVREELSAMNPGASGGVEDGDERGVPSAARGASLTPRR